MPITYRIRELRERKGWSQHELAVRARTSRETVNRIENAKVTRIDVKILERIAIALGVDVGYLVIQTRPPHR